ncbi:SDR family oxidoreductase [Cellulosimicrobium funkei]|nr:SDR family oxidoreductase [Cellulosimicrobium funkei]
MRLGVEGRTAVVLGSTSGLGWATARALADEGAQIVIVGRDEDRAKARASSLPAAIAVAIDLTEDSAPEHLLTVTQKEFGPVDILVLNGGGPKPSAALELTPEDVESTMKLLLSPYLELVNRVAPGMAERGWGRIIAIGSSGVQQPIPQLAASNVGRSALAGYLKTLAAELAPAGITVNMALPGRIDTDRVSNLDRATAERTSRSPEDVRNASQASIPAGRYGRPEEFAAIVTFLAGDPAAYITGEQIRCDGGMIRAH